MENLIYEQCDYKAKKEFVSCNIIEAIVATTGYCGGDSGHGGRTYLKLRDACCTDIEVNRLGSDYSCEGVEIMLGGDAELDTFIDALRWAADKLTDFLEMQHKGKIKGINIDYTKDDSEEYQEKEPITEKMLLNNNFYWERVDAVDSHQGYRATVMYHPDAHSNGTIKHKNRVNGIDTWTVFNGDAQEESEVYEKDVTNVEQLKHCLKELGLSKIVDKWRD